jgi:hypothetical protein
VELPPAGGWAPFAFPAASSTLARYGRSSVEDELRVADFPDDYWWNYARDFHHHLFAE